MAIFVPGNPVYTPSMPQKKQFRNQTRQLIQNNFTALNAMIDPNNAFIVASPIAQQLTITPGSTWYISNRKPNTSQDGFTSNLYDLFLQKRLSSTSVKSTAITKRLFAIDGSFFKAIPNQNSFPVIPTWLEAIYGFSFDINGYLHKYGLGMIIFIGGSSAIGSVFLAGSGGVNGPQNIFPVNDSTPAFTEVYSADITNIVLSSSIGQNFPQLTVTSLTPKELIVGYDIGSPFQFAPSSATLFYYEVIGVCNATI